MHATAANEVMCAWPGPCVQPGTRLVPCVQAEPRLAVVELEFCETHAVVLDDREAA